MKPKRAPRSSRVQSQFSSSSSSSSTSNSNKENDRHNANAILPGRVPPHVPRRFLKKPVPAPVTLPKEAPASEGTWKCDLCTFQNAPDSGKCEICSLTRPVEPKPPVPAPKLKLTVEEAKKYFNECLVECPKYGVRPKDYEFIEHIRLKWAYCQKTNLTRRKIEKFIEKFVEKRYAEESGNHKPVAPNHPPPPPPPKRPSKRDASPWTCNACTYQNKPLRQACEMCNRPRNPKDLS